MQTANRYRILTLVAALGLFSSQPAAAQTTYYFDVNNTTANSGVTNGGSYLWNSGGQTNWSTNSGGTIATSAGVWTSPGNNATFVAGTDGTGKAYTLTLTGGGAQTFVRALTVNSTGGNPEISVNGGNFVLGASSIWTVPTGATLTVSGVGSGTWGALNMNASTLTLNVDGDFNVSGLGNGGNVVKNGAGTATITGTSSFNVNPTANAGTLNLNLTNTATAGAVTAASTGILNVNGTLTAGAVSATGAGVLNVNGTLNSNAIAVTTGTGVMNVDGAMSATGLQISQSSASANSFVYVNNGGTLTLSGAVLIGQNASNSTGTLTINNGGVVNANSTDFRVANAVDGPTQTGILNLEAGSALNLSTAGSVLRVGNGSATNGTVNLNGGTLFINGQIRGDAPTGASAGTNTFNFNGGTLKAGVSITSFLQGMDAANVRNGGAKIDTNGFNVTVAQALQHSAISGDLAIDGGLLKIGGGTLTLTGVNTYTGGTTLSAGGLAVGASTTAIGSGALTLSGGTFSGSSGGAIGIANAVTATASTTSTLQGGGGASYLLLSGNISGAGTIQTASVGGNVRLSGDNSGFSGTMIVNDALYLNHVNSGSANANWQVNGASSLVGNVSGGTFQLGALTGSGAVSAGGGTQTFSIGALNSNSTFSGTIINAGVTAIAKVGSGTLTLTGANTYTGTTTISGGVLQVGGGGATGTLGSGAVINNATLTINRSNALNLANVISGSGALRQIGAGTTTLSSANSYSGGTIVTDGTLASGVNNAIGDGAVTVNGASAILNLGGFNDTVGAVTLAGGGQINSSTGVLTSTGGYDLRSGLASARLAGAVGAAKTTSGTVILSGNNTYTGTTSVNAGTLLVNGTHTGAGAYTVAAGATLGGTGTITPIGAAGVSVFGTVAPGASIGTLTFNLGSTTGGVNFQSGAAFDFEVDAPGVSDLIRFNNFTLGDVVFNNNVITLVDFGNFAPGLYTLFAFYSDNGVTPINHNLTSGLVLADNAVGTLLYNGNLIQVQLDAIVPEPSSWVLCGLGVALLGGVVWRKRRQGGARLSQGTVRC